MNKNKKNDNAVQKDDGTKVATPIVSIDSTSSSNGLKKLTGSLHKLASLIALLIIVVLVILGLILWHNESTNKNKVTNSDEPKIQSLLNSFDCSPSAINSVASYSPSAQAVDTSIKLLNYRSSCDIKNNNYTKALADYKVEQNYCKLANDTPCVDDLQIFINNLSKSLGSSTNNTPSTVNSKSSK